MRARHRFLLVGLGNRGRMWASLLARNERVTLDAVVDSDPARLDAVLMHSPELRGFSDIGTAIETSRPDAVCLATPPDGHLDQARAIFAYGLPLLCEKPLADNLEQARAIVRLSETAGKPLSVGLNFRYLPVTRAIRDLVARREFGEPGFAHFAYHRDRDGRRVGLNKYPLTMRHPMMLEQSIHHLDLLRFAYSREVEAVSCRTWNPGWSMYAHDSNVACQLTFENGLEATYLGTWTGGWGELRFEWRTDCADGVIIQRELFDDLAVARRDEPKLRPVEIEACTPFVDDTSRLLDDFIDCLERGSPPPCGGRDHLRSLALCFAAIESSETGRRIQMREFLARRGLGDLG